jgi:hypothetical protein
MIPDWVRLDLHSLFKAEPERGERVLRFFEERNWVIDPRDVRAASPYAMAVFDGKAPLPERAGSSPAHSTMEER